MNYHSLTRSGKEGGSSYVAAVVVNAYKPIMRPRQSDGKFKSSLGYIVTPHLKNQN